MSIQLTDKSLALTVETAGEKYTGSRFDWNGTVVQVRYCSIPVLSQEKLPFHRNPRIDGRGLHNEFGIKNCIGYDEVPAGGLFPKIGTGWLVKNDKPYFFAAPYEVKRLQFSSEKTSPSEAVFTCISGEQNGYSYTYIKTISLDGNSFTIAYTLENTGTKNLATTEYVHNFLNPGRHGTGPHLSLSFPWSFSPERLAEDVKTDGVIGYNGNTMNIRSVPDHEFFTGGTWQARDDAESEKYMTMKGGWTLTDEKDHMTISERDSFVPCGADVWGHRADISPEIFTSFDIAPGASCSWSRTYTFNKTR
jgi:hypothetical protein